MTRSSPTSAATSDGDRVLYFGVEDDSLALAGMAHAADAKHCRRCGAPYCVRRDLSRPSRPLPLPELRTAAPATVDQRSRRRSSRGSMPPAFGCELRPAKTPSDSRFPACTTSTTRSRRPRWQRRSRSHSRACSRACATPARRSGARRSSRSPPPAIATARPARRATCASWLVENPAGANEVLRTLAARAGRAPTCSAYSTIRSPTDATVSWIWDADFELLAGEGAAVHVQRDPRGRARDADQVRGGGRSSASSSSPTIRRALDAAAASQGRDPGAALRAAHIHGDARAARAARRARGAKRRMVVSHASPSPGRDPARRAHVDAGDRSSGTTSSAAAIGST